MITYAQEKPVKIKDDQTAMQQGDMQKCMDKIAADSTLRLQMMDKMMSQCKSNKEAMMQMCKEMKKNMKCEGMMECERMKHKMNCDSTKTTHKCDRDSLHHKK